MGIGSLGSLAKGTVTRREAMSFSGCSTLLVPLAKNLAFSKARPLHSGRVGFSQVALRL